MREWENNIRKVVPYVAGEQPNKKDMVKLNTNECPYPPTKKLFEAFNSMDLDRIRLYPDPDAKPLVSAIAEFYNVSEDMIFVGVGSDDVLANVFLTFFNSDKPIFFPDITYSFYPVWANVYDIPYRLRSLDKDYRIVPEDYYEENGGVIFPNPNAPTGVYEDLSVVEDIVKNNQKSVVVVDEAYIDFGGESALKLVEQYENLLVVQTFSKSRSTAGLRIGFAIGNKALIQAMKEVKFSINSYTMNMPSIIGGAAVMADREYFDIVRHKIITTREHTKVELSKRGFDFPDSKANFIFATHKDYDVTDMFKYLREKNVYVRHWNAEEIKDYLRISIGTDEEMEKFFEVVDMYMEEKN